MRAPELTRLGRDILEAAGWVTNCMNSRHPTPRGMLGFPDVPASRDGVHVQIEVKAEGDRLNDHQKAYIEKMLPHLSNHLLLCLAESLEDFEQIANYRAEDGLPGCEVRMT